MLHEQDKTEELVGVWEQHGHDKDEHSDTRGMNEIEKWNGSNLKWKGKV